MREFSTTHLFSRFAVIFFSLAFGAAFIAMPAVPARAAGPQPLAGSLKIAETAHAAWTIEADKLSYDQGKQLYEAEGNVKISSRDRMITAENASVNNQTRQADLRGKVTIQYGRNWVKGEHITWNLDSETGWLDSGVIYFAENNFFIQGKSISKLGPTEFELKEGFITSCNPADPDWKIQFNHMMVTVGGTAKTQDASLWARSAPIAYWPLLDLPVERDRQSGFLIPWAGTSSLNGYEMEIPYYWAISDDMDATFYARYMQNRGLMEGGEYRINNPEWGKGIFMFNFLNDQASNSLLQRQEYPFQTEDRYWLRGHYDVNLPWGIEAKLDLDFVSDRNYLQEFSKGSSSFFDSDTTFRQYFGHGLLYDPTSLVRESTLYLEKRGESDLLSMDVRYWQDLVSTLETTQKLPALYYTVIPKWIDDTPLYYTVQSSAVNYWSPEGTTEQRLDVHPRTYYPMHWGNYLDIEPSVGFRADSYTIQWESGSGNSNTLAERIAPDVKVEMSTRLNRDFQVDFLNFTGLEHAIRPEVSYEYATQSSFNHQIPQLDQLDENLSRDGVRYGFSTFLTGREVITDADGNPTTTYRELVRLRVFQFFNVQQPAIEDPLFDTTNAMREGFSPVGFRLDLLPKRYLTFSYDLDLDLLSGGKGQAQSIYMTLDSGRGQLIRLDYQQIQNFTINATNAAINEINVSTVLRAYKDIYINTYHDYSFSGLLFTQGYGIKYIRGCWGVGAGYERVGTDNRFLFTLDMLGLGSLGQSGFFGKTQFGEPFPGSQHPESWVMTR